MWLARLLYDPAHCPRVAVCLAGGILLPLHVGWVGGSWADFLAYFVVASLLLAAPGGLIWPIFRPRRQAYPMLSLMTALLLAAPAALAFSLGSSLGSVDETLDEELCAAQGLGEADSPTNEADDTIDVTPDCDGQATGRVAR